MPDSCTCACAAAAAPTKAELMSRLETALADVRDKPGGLIPALHSFVKSFSKRTRLHVHLKVFAGIEQLDISRRTVLYRIAQEALANVARHAHASRVEVNIQKLRGAARLEIKDDGRAFAVERTLNARGSKRLGLLGMKERVEMVGGTFGIESAPGQGTCVRVEIPFAPSPEKPFKPI